MRSSRIKTRIFKNERAREWVTDFMIGIGMFVLVAIFASTHTDSALPAPLAKTEAMLAQTSEPAKANRVQTFRTLQFVSSQGLTSSTRSTPHNSSNNRTLMIVMALVFSALLTLTIQFWRNLRRAYASPRRKWGRG